MIVAGIKPFYTSLKKEEVYTAMHSNFKEVNRVVFHSIEGFYNRNRIHSSIHYLAPQEFENQTELIVPIKICPRS